MTAFVRPASFGNVHSPGTDFERHSTIDQILNAAKGGVASFNEADKDQSYIRKAASARGMRAIGRGELAIAYDVGLVLVGHWYLKISPGGYIGADGVKTARRGDDDRRVGPNRYILLAVFWDPVTLQSFFRFTSHDIAKAGTTHKWRQGILFGGWRRVSSAINQVIEDVPAGSGDGDKNWSKPVNYPGTPDRNVPTPPTFGGAKYDQIQLWGPIKVIGSVSTIKTPSDHKGLSWSFEVNDTPGPKPEVELDIRGLPVAIGDDHPEHQGRGRKAPVRRPWIRRSRRWKRRHPILWRRILRWRKNNPHNKPYRRPR